MKEIRSEIRLTDPSKFLAILCKLRMVLDRAVSVNTESLLAPVALDKTLCFNFARVLFPGLFAFTERVRDMSLEHRCCAYSP